MDTVISTAAAYAEVPLSIIVLVVLAIMRRREVHRLEQPEHRHRDQPTQQRRPETVSLKVGELGQRQPPPNPPPP